MFVLSTPNELSPEAKKKLRELFMEKPGEDCIVLDLGLQVSHISVKKDSATGGKKWTRRRTQVDSEGR